MGTIHDWPGRLADGDKNATELDAFFSNLFEVNRTRMEIDKAGIDRVFVHRVTNKRYSVEYKSDSRAATTGNAFIEIVSVDTTGAPGWALTCLAQWVVYYIPPWRKGYWIRTCAIKAKVERWQSQYRIATCQNETYNSAGILVPLHQLEPLGKTFVLPPLPE